MVHGGDRDATISLPLVVVTVSRFDPASPLMLVRGYVWGPRGVAVPLQLVLDTGAAESTIAPEILDEMGYSPRQGEAITTVRSAVGAEPGYLLRVTRFHALGYEFSNFRVHAHDLPEGCGIDGLLGLSFLRHFNYEIRSAEGRILVNPLSDFPPPPKT